MEAGVTWLGRGPIVWAKGGMPQKPLTALYLALLFTRALCRAADNFLDSQEERVLEQQQKVHLGRSVAWNQLELHVRKGHLEQFKGDLTRYSAAGLLQDRDSGYFEVLQAIAAKRPRPLSHQMLQPFLRLMCSKSIIQLLPDLLDDLDIEGLLLVRKYCPVGGGNVEGLLEMFPGAQEGRPLARYLLESWEDPVALEYTRTPFRLESVFSDMKGPAGLGAPMDGRDMFLRLDRLALHFRYHNLVLFSEGMHRDHLTEVMVPLLRMLDGRVDSKSELHRLSNWMDRYPGSLSMALLTADRIHLWQRGAGTFVVIAQDEAAEVETALYPLGSAFKSPSTTLRYSTVEVRTEALLLYVSAAVVDQIHLHDLVGSVLYATDDPVALQEALKMFYERLVKARTAHTEGEGGSSTLFRVFQVQPNDVRERPVQARRERPVRRFHFADSTFALGSSRESGESDISLGPRFYAHHQQRRSRHDPLWSLLNESEASYDDNEGLASSSEEGLEETLFERRRWWTLESSEAQSQSHGYDSSMSRDFFYRRPEILADSLFSHQPDNGNQQSYE